MTEEEKKAKLKSLIEEYEICLKESKYEGNTEEYKSLKETHKLLKDILKLIDKKDKVIDLMAEDIRQVIGDDNYMEMTKEETIQKYIEKVEEENE